MQNTNKTHTDGLTHDLDINKYSLEELFGLFDLSYDLTEEAMKKAKKKVLMLHPDKSQLPSIYFLFYKKAYDLILDLYKSRNKINTKPTASDLVYNPDSHSVFDPNLKVDGAAGKEFQSRFNQAFEQNITKKHDPSLHEWFKQDTKDEFTGRGINVKNMGEALESVKEKQRQQAVTLYKGVQEMRNYSCGTSFYDDDDESAASSYVECDVFSKLKFEDVRKVHRDQTVIGVSERDLANNPQYGMNYDQYMNARERSVQAGALSKHESEAMLAKQRAEAEQNLMRKQQRDLLMQQEYAKKQQQAMSSFLRLGR